MIITSPKISQEKLEKVRSISEKGTAKTQVVALNESHYFLFEKMIARRTSNQEWRQDFPSWAYSRLLSGTLSYSLGFGHLFGDYLREKFGRGQTNENRKSLFFAGDAEIEKIQGESEVMEDKIHRDEVLLEAGMAVEKMSPKEIRLFKLLFKEDFSQAEAAEAMGVTPQATNVMWNKMLKKIRKKILID